MKESSQGYLPKKEGMMKKILAGSTALLFGIMALSGCSNDAPKAEVPTEEVSVEDVIDTPASGDEGSIILEEVEEAQS